MMLRPVIWGLLGVMWSAVSAGPALGDPVGSQCKDESYERLLRMCSGLQEATIDTGLVDCMENILPDFRGLTDECQDVYLPQTIAGMEPVVQKFAGRVSFDSDTRRLNTASLKEYFLAVNLWLDLFHGYDPRSVEPRMQQFSAAYWRHVNKLFVANNVTAKSEIFANNTAAIRASFETAQETVLLSMQLTVATFDQMEEQIATIAAIEDYYCQIDNCELSKAPERFYTYRLAKAWRYFYRPVTSTIDSASAGILALLHSHQDKIFSQINRWFFDQINNQSLFDFPPVQRRFIGIFKTFALLLKNKDNGGFFSGSNAAELRSGFDRDFKDRVLRRLKEQNTELEADLADFDRLKAEHLALILQQHQNDQSILELDSNWNVLTTEYRNLEKDIRGLELSNLKKSRSFAEYNTTIQKNEDVFRQYFKTEGIATGGDALTVTAKDAKFTGSFPDSDISRQGFKVISGTAGQVLNINVAGQYSPTCSLAKSPYFDGTSVPAGLKYGPEGFVVKLTKGKSSVESVSTGRSNSSYDGYESNRPTCPRGRKKACGGYVEGSRNTQYTNNTATDSKHSDMSAHFSIGLKLPLTPFYDFPAGSLLAFIMASGEKDLGKARDVRVLSRQNQLVLDRDSDVYLVVNDCINPDPDSSNALGVTISKTIGLAQGQQMIEQFTQALAKAKKEGAAIVAAGANVTSEVNLLIKKVIAEFAMAGSDNSFYKIPKLRDLFDYWLHNEGQIILNRAKIKELDRRVSVLAYKLNANADMRANEGSRNHLNQLRFQNLLANIDSNLIHTKLADVLSFGSGVTLPMIRFHYPDLLSRVAQKVPAPQITILSSFKTIGQYVSAMTGQVASTFSDEDAISRQKGQYRSMVLYFPRPAEAFPGKVYFGSGLADVNRSYSLWDAFINKEKNVNETTLSFYEHDFYRLDGAPGFLRCDIENPVLMDSMIGFVFKKETITDKELKLMNGYGMVSGVEFSPLQRFATRSGLKNFRLKDPTIGTSSIAFGFVRENEIRGLVEIMDSKGHTKDTGIGLSPVSDIKLKDIKTIKDVFERSCDRCNLKNLTGIAVAFKVYFKHTNVDLNWPKACIEPELNPIFKNVYLPQELASLDAAAHLSQE